MGLRMVNEKKIYIERHEVYNKPRYIEYLNFNVLVVFKSLCGLCIADTTRLNMFKPVQNITDP